MKTTVELPDELLRTAKIRAAREGTTLRAVLTRALETELASDVSATRAPRWQKHAGKLRHLRAESASVRDAIASAFGSVDEDAWQ